MVTVVVWEVVSVEVCDVDVVSEVVTLVVGVDILHPVNDPSLKESMAPFISDTVALHFSSL